MLEVENVDWHLLENAKVHHTDRYEIVHEESTPVLRRSQPFKISITFKNRPFNETTDRIRVLMNNEKAKAPRLQSVFENTAITSSNKINGSKTKWSLQLMKQQGKTITMQLRSPPTAAWGKWNLSLRISFKLNPQVVIWKCPTQLWLLFNPWSKDDDVYMPETRYLDEYILNDVGKVYTKGIGKPIGMRWIYGQFTSTILKVLYDLLGDDIGEDKLGSPVALCQGLRRVGRIIEGNWGSDYEGGTKPWLWTGSVPIYNEYYTTKSPAKWAQCYVYGAIFTTALRAAGIPSRNVSNFISATGGEATMSVNYIYDSKGETIDSPMIWNFHVWNDAWMARYDLPSGYGGWQAIDVNGIGLASVLAVKKGEISLKYHTDIILAECNSDRVRWTKDDNGEYHLISVDTQYVGKAMLTKQPFIYDPHGDTDFEDIITTYKEPEGSREERMSIYNAIKYRKKIKESDDVPQEGDELYEMYMEFIAHQPPQLYHADVPIEDPNIKFELVQYESILFGQPLKIILKVENSGDKPATVEACLGSSSIYYNSATAGLIKRENKMSIVPAHSNDEILVEIKPEEYAAKLVEFTLLKGHGIATVVENKYTWADDFQLNVEMPEIIITAKNDLQVNMEGTIVFRFKNLLKTKLTKCNITYEAPGIGRNVKIICRDIEEGEETAIEHKVKPTAPGQTLINATFNSKELNFLGGSSVLEVHI